MKNEKFKRFLIKEGMSTGFDGVGDDQKMSVSLSTKQWVDIISAIEHCSDSDIFDDDGVAIEDAEYAIQEALTRR